MSHRITLAGYLGTVRYTGPVQGTSGTWLGVEWDDPKRGKHDGVKDALTSKYIEALHGSSSQEQVILGSSKGNIIVEAVNLDKIRGKLADLSRLREVSLDGLGVASYDPPGMIQRTSPSIRGLDLSKTLLPSWDVVASIACELPALTRLYPEIFSRNRLLPPTNAAIMESAFLNLTELQLNGTLLPWSEMQDATAAMPNLEIIEMGYNSLKYLHTSDEYPPIKKTVRVINLDSNACVVNHGKSLQRLIIPSNSIDAIPFPGQQQDFSSIKHISLSGNKIQTLRDVDALSSWCPGLEALTLSGNPLTSQAHARPFTISKIPTLVTLDGAEVEFSPGRHG
ncbi:hypothetical protein C0991_002426 [Blastosporella zonata]|nr:hypothetical protein C0991_002426 [Blastosporella zonata]